MKKSLLFFALITTSLFELFSQSITVTAPNGGEQWAPGTSQTIAWTSSGGITDVNIFYSTNNGTTFSLVAAFQPNSGTYSWTIPSASSTQCLVKVVDFNNSNTTDTSNAVFTIAVPATLSLLKPNGGNVLTANSTYGMDWNSTGLTLVDIFFSSDSGLNWNIVVADYSATGNPYTWTVPNIASSACLVYITGVDGLGNSLSDTSNSFFSITIPTSITVTYPNGGENLIAGTTDTITWTSTGTINYLEFYYSTDGGSTWNFINDGIQNTGYYIWTVPSVSSTNCLMLINEIGGSGATDTSNAVFTISAPAASLTLTSPNGGEQWTVGTNQNITWTSSGITSNVILKYSVNYGQTWTLINGVAPNTGSYSWTVPNIPQCTTKVKISDYTDTTIYDISSASFCINAASATLTITSPNGGENWIVGAPYNITWTSTGTINTVDLYYSTNGGSTWSFINDFISNTGSYSWIVPNYPSTNCKIKVVDTDNPTTIYDVSNSTFTIGSGTQQSGAYYTITSPNGGEAWYAQSNHYIYWADDSVSNYVTLEYSINNGSAWNTIISGTYNYGYYNWTVPNYPSTNCKVRISDYYDSTTTDISDNVFTILAAPATITVSTPNNGETWAEGSNQYIYWSSQYVDSVKIEYTINNGSSWNLAVANTPASAGSYSWLVPNTPSDFCKVRISQVSNPSVYDVSDNVFKIIISDITVTTPNGGEMWTGNEYKYIYWNSIGISSYVKIDYSLNNGTSWTNIVNGAYNYGYYNWYVPNTPSAQCLVKVSDYYSNSITDSSDNVFTILAAPPVITVSTPNNGETWAEGSSQYIYWSSQYVDSVKIEYTINNGSSWNLVTASALASTGSYNWSVPNTPSNFCKVRISQVSNPSVFDVSDNVFKIVLSDITVTTPNGGEVWTGNTYQYIYWNSTGISNYVKIDYSLDNGTTWTNIVNGASNSGNYNWYIPNTPSTQCLVKVSDYYSNAINDSSNAMFTISAAIPYITVTTPNGGEQWLGGSSQYIYWSSTNSTNVKVEYSINNGLVWNTIVASTPASNGYYYWNPIPSTPSTQCLVKVSDVSQTQYYDVSNSTFSILDPYITVTDPNGGETYLISSNRYIYWNYGGTSNYVTIEYSTDGGTAWNTIVAGASNNGSYYWNVPNTPSTTCKVRISDYYNGTITDISDNNFTIATGGSTGTITVSTPNGSEQWTAGSSYYIYWSSDLVDTVNIYYSINNGSSYTLIAGNVAASTGYYYWSPVPATPSNQCRVKVESSSNSSIYDASNNTFSIIVPSYTLTSPNGGEVLTGGTYSYIYWTSQGVSSYTRLDYSTDNGTTWTNITNGISNTGSYNWYVPNTPSMQCLIKVSDYYNNSIADSSNAVFTINPATPILTLSAPNGGQNILVGSSYGIQWTTSFVDSVKIEYSTNNGSTWNLIAASLPAANNYYTWMPVPNTPSTQCLVKISDVANSSYFDISNYVFSISQPYLLVTTPNGGESWTAYTYKYIYWTGAISASYVRIDYSVNGGSTWNNIVNGASNNNQYQWYVPDSPSVNCLVKVSDYYDTTVKDVSDAVFTINAPTPLITLSAPNGGQNIIVGSSYGIQWSASYIDSIRIEYSTNNGSSWNLVAASVLAANNYYTWSPVPNTPSTQCLVKITDISDSAYFDVSNYAFTITQPYLMVTTPNGGESWYGNTYKYIYWTGAISASYVKIDYSINGGSSWNNIINGASNNNQYQWYVPDSPSVNCLVKVSDYYDTTVKDVSDAVFTINAPLPTVTVTTPNGGQSWLAGSSQYIYWSSANITNVKLEYSINNGNSWNTIISSAPASNGYYSWPLPNVNSTLCKVRVTNTNDSTIYDISDNVFTIYIPGITLTSPNGGEQWQGGSNQYIYWTSTGLSSYVKIDYSINSGNTWTNIVNGASNSGSYYWSVPNTFSDSCLVKISDYYDTSLTDVSNALFSITSSNPTITVTSPAGGDQWGTGSGHYITWTSYNVTNVKIEYSTNGGTAWTNIVTSTPANNGSYYWTLPNTLSQNCFVRVSDVSNSSINDMNNFEFGIISPDITLTQPNGGQQWVAGTSQNITWTSSGASNYVTLYYSINYGSSWYTIANGVNNNGSYSWSVPNNPSASCLVKITDYYNSNVYDVSNLEFTILPPPPSLILTDPNGGEVFAVGSTQYIYWTSASISYVKLEYSYNGGSTWNVIISSVPASNGSYSWPIPNTPTSTALVRVSDASNPGMNDASNGNFSIVLPNITVTTPNGGENWTGLTNQYIYWNSSAVSNYVTIEYSVNNGSSWSMVANGTYNSGSYNWTVPNTPSSTCLVRVKDYYSNTIFDVSNNTFTILAAPASIVVNSPNGGELWGVGTTQNITWSSSGVTNVKLEYSTNGGSSWNVIIGSAPASNGYYNWPVPNAPSSNCYVKISNVADTSITDQSNNYFTITNPMITVTSPNGGETWTAGTGYYIYWTSSGISNYVKIQYSTDNGGTWSNIANSAYNNGSYWWTVPNTPSTTCLVRVTDYYNSLVYDVSNSVFSIVSPPPSITVTSPNGGETWVVGSTYYIYWNSTGVSNVKLEYSTNGGSTWNTIIASATNNGSYNWPVPNAPSTTCLVKVSDASNPGTNDVSNNNFTISAPYITLTQPNGGETLQATNGYYITWTSAGVSYIKIEYSIDNGANWNMIVSSTYNNGYYYWTVPNNPSTNCIVKVSSTVNPAIVNDQSNTIFTIIPPVPTITLNSPNSGEYWYVGYQYYITWSSSAVSNVKLEYSTDGGSNWNVIIASTPANSGFYYWPVANTPSVNCKVRVSDASNSSVNDFSYGMFTIATPVPSVTVNYPNGGENWYEGSYQYVSWTKNFVNTVNLEYSIDSGTTWNMLVSNSSSNYYYWSIPNTPSILCFVKVTSATDTSVYDRSNAVFTISIYIPNTNTITTDSIAPLPFCKEDTINVYFTGNGVFNAGNVFTAQLSDSNGNFTYPLAIGSIADTVSGNIDCVVPSYVLNATGYRVRVVASDLPTTGTNNGSDITISSPEFDFAASETIKYLPDGSVQFSFIGDTSNVASYEWSMGNGDSTTVSNPAYVYSAIGYYTVDLTVTDNIGCDINLSKYNYMRIEQLLPNTQLSTNTTVDLTDVYFSDIATGVMTMADGNCLVTLDSGVTWTTSYTGLTGYAASVSMQPGYWFITGANGSIVYSIDSGLTWSPQYTGTLETFYGSSFSAPNFGFSVGTNGVIYNYNGTSWAAQTSGISAALNSVFTLGSIAYSVGINGSILYYNGSTWATQTAPVSANLNSVYFTGSSTGLAVGDNGYILNYDGTNWNVALSGVDVNFSSVTATGDSAWAVSNSGIIYWSDDAGLSWMRYSVGTTTDLSGISYVKSGGKAASSSRGYIGGKGGEGRMIGSDGAEDTTTVIRQTVIAKNNFIIYPNPALDIIYLETALDKKESIVIQLRDINGNLVKTIADAEVSGFYREQADVSSLASGIYFVHVSQGEKFWVRKIVVQ